MKKICKLLLVFMLFFVTSCSKEEANVENNVNDEHQIKNNHSNVLNSNEIGDIIAIDGLKEINISDITIFDSKYYRNGLNINLNENLLNKKITISLENGKEWINISEVVLEPLKLTADNKAESVIFSLDNLGTIKAKDIDDETIKLFSKYIKESNTIFFNGPVGVFEFENFSYGTKKILEEMKCSKAKVIVGGGDSASAAIKFGFKD